MSSRDAHEVSEAHEEAHEERPATSVRSFATFASFVCFVVLVSLAAAAAQDFPSRRGFQGFGRRDSVRMAGPDSFDGSFNFCRVMYESVRREDGGTGWWTDYAAADAHFSIRLSELTKTRVSWQPSGEPNYVVVRLTDPALFQCPYVHMEDAGTAWLSDTEVVKLREYLLKGGFLWVDDFWGEAAWEWWVGHISRVLPPGEYAIKDLPMDHPLFRMMFEVTELPQIPSIQHWRRSGGETSERGEESAVPDIRGISDKEGRLMVLMTHDTDISDAWEREEEDPRFFYAFSPRGYAVGINVMLYAMSH
jgi:hypothetical protein